MVLQPAVLDGLSVTCHQWAKVWKEMLNKVHSTVRRELILFLFFSTVLVDLHCADKAHQQVVQVKKTPEQLLQSLSHRSHLL